MSPVPTETVSGRGGRTSTSDLIGVVILAAGAGVNAWMLGLATVVAALGSMVLGLGLGIARLAQPRLNR